MKILRTIKRASIIAVIGSIAYLYKTDPEVREKLNALAFSLRDIASEVTSRMAESKVESQEQMYANQQWAESQWDALGVK